MHQHFEFSRSLHILYESHISFGTNKVARFFEAKVTKPGLAGARIERKEVTNRTGLYHNFINQQIRIIITSLAKMCLCQTPDKRSDYTLLQFTQKGLTAEASYIERNVNINREEDNHSAYFAANRTYPTARNVSHESHNDYSGYNNSTKWSKWEMWIRWIMVACLLLTSVALHEKQKEVKFQQEQLNDSINRIDEIKQRLRQRNMMNKQNTSLKQVGNNHSDEKYLNRLATLGIEYDGRTQTYVS